MYRDVYRVYGACSLNVYEDKRKAEKYIIIMPVHFSDVHVNIIHKFRVVFPGIVIEGTISCNDCIDVMMHGYISKTAEFCIQQSISRCVYTWVSSKKVVNIFSTATGF